MSKLFILGGASRTGKGLMAHELMIRHAMPYLTIDPIKMAISRTIPEYKLDTNAGSIEVAEQLWPYVTSLLKNLLETNVPYIVEGEVLPKHIAALKEEHDADEIRACFVGYGNISVDTKFYQIKENAGYPNDWTSTLKDTDLKVLIRSSIEFSRYLKDECKKYDLHYVDFSDSFEAARSHVLDHFSE